MEFKVVTRIFCLLVVLCHFSDACAPDNEECLLPDCFCPGLVIPGGLELADTPQIVYITFDDAINVVNAPIYDDIFYDRVNPNDEPITGTFYVTHEYNDYKLTHEFWNQGHEIALHSITHQTNTQYWRYLNATGWSEEMVEQKKMMAHFAAIDIDSITGMRAPFLQTGADEMMKSIYGEFKYDCSRPTLSFIDPGLWPYTLDYDTDYQDCQIEPCAIGQYKGFWNVPMVDWTGDDGFPCAMMDQCLPDPDTPEKVFNLMKRNFLRSYGQNKAPFGIFIHSAWLGSQFPGHLDGYLQFLDYLGTLDDVFIVSVQRAIEWFKKPTPLSAINDFEPWQVPLKPNKCKSFNNCRYDPKDTPFPSERYMKACTPCPPKYPWLRNPLGERQ